MNTSTLYSIIFFSFGGIGLIVFVSLFFISAPYGRHQRAGWGITIENKAGWIIMEAAAPACFFIFFLLGSWKSGVMPYLFLFLWMFHYLYRSFVFPSLIRGTKTMPLAIALFAVVFNGVNAYLQGRYLYSFAGPAGKYPLSWIGSPRFLIGVGIFFAGFIIHARSDQILRNLRKPGESGYKIPRGWLFRWISSPNYFGEIVQWAGWAVCTWSCPGLLFLLWTFFNLFPRALSNHRWYIRQFPDYPGERNAIIPGLL